ncbi:hypothetical protein Bca52824_086704 [Brassica carinata]|uniref:Uncharacterized protein n=1 Tax=Brassica carinata TaxID=52824 RepID=A0A8X7P8A9_BRACI|nr:hypothetical protein Bca52824_086704 [Brassica carinata]
MKSTGKSPISTYKSPMAMYINDVSPGPPDCKRLDRSENIPNSKKLGESILEVHCYKALHPYPFKHDDICSCMHLRGFTIARIPSWLNKPTILPQVQIETILWGLETAQGKLHLYCISRADSLLNMQIRSKAVYYHTYSLTVPQFLHNSDSCFGMRPSYHVLAGSRDGGRLMQTMWFYRHRPPQ